MAVAQHLETLNRGTDHWNAWRSQNPRIRPVLTGVTLNERDFNGINLLKANLSGSALARSQFRYASLRYTDLSGCDLTGVDFEGANLMMADLTGAILTGARLNPEQIADAHTDETTVLPEDI